MAMNQTQSTDAYASGTRVIAFLKDKNDAYRAINQLREAGFSSAETGLMAGDESGTATGSRPAASEHESFWDKLKNFFTGESHDDVDYGDTSSGMDWDLRRADYYYRGISSGGALVSVTGTRVEEARRILKDAGGDLRESGFEETNTPDLSSGNDTRRIQLRGEMLRTYKERVQRGEVRLRKEVVTENQTVEVPVTREELVIERVPVSGESRTGEVGTETDEIRVPLSEERVRAEKQPMVTDEIRVGKRATQSTENVSEDLRHEELRVDKEGDVNVDSESIRPGKRSKKPAA